MTTRQGSCSFMCYLAMLTEMTCDDENWHRSLDMVKQKVKDLLQAKKATNHDFKTKPQLLCIRGTMMHELPQPAL